VLPKSRKLLDSTEAGFFGEAGGLGCGLGRCGTEAALFSGSLPVAFGSRWARTPSAQTENAARKSNSCKARGIIAAGRINQTVTSHKIGPCPALLARSKVVRIRAIFSVPG